MTKLFKWVTTTPSHYGYCFIEVLANDIEEAIKIVEKEQKKYMVAKKKADDYEKKIMWQGTLCGHKVNACTCLHKVTPELRKLWDAWMGLPNWEDELNFMKANKPDVVLDLDVPHLPSIFDSGGYIE